MNALLDLKRFIACKSRPDEAPEVLGHVLANAETYAPEFGVTPQHFMIALLRPESDPEIVKLLLATIKGAERQKRASKAHGKVLSAQESARLIGEAVIWNGARAEIDIAGLLVSTLTKANALLVFSADGFEVAVYQKPLLALAKLKKPDVTGWVDASGVHVRWNQGQGGLDLVHQVDPDAERVIVNLPARQGAIAA
jgi:hypothetical protein